MGDVAEMLDVSHSLIRFWEKKFDIIKPHKNKKGNRMFTPEDVRNLKMIYHLVKERGMTLAGAQKHMKASRKEIERDMELTERLQSIRSLLAEVRDALGTDGTVMEEVFNEIVEPLHAENAAGHLPEAVKDEVVNETEIADEEIFVEAAATDEPDPWDPVELNAEEEAEEVAPENETTEGKEDTADMYDDEPEEMPDFDPEPVFAEEPEDSADDDDEDKPDDEDGAGEEDEPEEPKKPYFVEQTLFDL